MGSFTFTHYEITCNLSKVKIKTFKVKEHESLMSLEPEIQKPTYEVGNRNNFNLKHWYQFLLYLGGAILVIGFYFYLQYLLIDVYQPYYLIQRVMGFAIFTIVIGAALWFIDEILYYKEIHQNHSVDLKKTFKRLLIERLLSWIILLFIWIYIAILIFM